MNNEHILESQTSFSLKYTNFYTYTLLLIELNVSIFIEDINALYLISYKYYCKGQMCFWFLAQKRTRLAHYPIDKTS